MLDLFHSTSIPCTLTNIFKSGTGIPLIFFSIGTTFLLLFAPIPISASKITISSTWLASKTSFTFAITSKHRPFLSLKLLSLPPLILGAVSVSISLIFIFINYTIFIVRAVVSFNSVAVDHSALTYLTSLLLI